MASEAKKSEREAPTVATTEDNEDTYVLHDDGETLASLDTFSLTTEGISIYGKKANGWSSLWSAKIVSSRTFKRAVITLIVLNSITTALSTFDFVRDHEDLKILFDGLDAFFLIVFTVELFLKFTSKGPAFFTDGWHVFDLLVVSSAWFLHPLLALRTFRLVRTFRLATRVRDLHYLVTALLSVVPKVLCIVFLMCILFFTFSIVFTDLFKDLYKDGYTSVDYFSRMDTTAWTLFQIMTLDNWGAITHEVMQVYSWAWFPFLLFIASSSFFFLNLVIAVICEAVSKVQHDRQISKLRRQVGLTKSNTQDSHVSTGQRSVKSLRIHSDSEEENIMRLERKVDKLTETVEMLLKLQTQPFVND